MSPDELAQACAKVMWDHDQASAGLGMVLEHIGPGTARMSMVVQARMLNGHGSCHGGFIFTLADSAFAFACNTGGLASVASQCSVSFLRPVLEGERMLAVAEERYREGRSGITDVRVTVEGGVVAEFRGHSRTTGQRMANHAP
ncbi:MAG: hydroxyphenylacetyl-CoA thioesterase PaaI [Janthinobacterium lividum]